MVLVPDDLLPPGREKYRVFGDIPVPDTIPASPDGELPALLSLAEQLFGGLVYGDVMKEPHHILLPFQGDET